AQKNGDRIFAIIRGSAINQDGPSSGLTVPNSEAQKMLLRAALHNARVAPQQMQYVEAHGTGTSLGDPIEVRALGEVLNEGRAPEHTLIIGSAKTNLGHLESAAGVAGVIKTALALHHGEIPPHLHFQKLNPDISLEAINARIPTQLLPWPAWGETRLAGVSAFGMSGTNVHVILQGVSVRSEQSSVISDQLSVNSDQLSVISHQSSVISDQLSVTSHKLPLVTDNCSLDTDHCSLMTEQTDRTHHLLTLSAKDEIALKQMAERYAQDFNTPPDLNLADACYTANVGRAQFRHRVAVVASSLAQAQSRLTEFFVDKEAPGLMRGAAQSGAKKNLAFLYAGQGYQYIGMGRVLYQTQPTFRKALLQCDELFRPYLKTSLLGVLYPELSNTPLKDGIVLEDDLRSTIHDPRSSILAQPPLNLLDQTFYTQPAMFALQYALTQLWLSWGFTPTVVMGHSLGEFMAAQLAGVYSLEDAVKLVAERGRLTEDVPAVGMMASVQASAETVMQALAAYGENICLAAINGPDSVVITGIKAEVNDLLARFEREGVNVRRLAISNAFHSQFIDPALDRFSRVAAEVTYHQPKLPLVSTLTGKLLSFELQVRNSHDSRSSILDHQSTIHDPQTYWRRHLREPVQFYAAIRTLHEMGVENFLEIGPNPTQLGMGRRCLPEGYGNWFPSLRQGRDDWQQLLESVGAMFVSGLEVDWPRFEQDYARRRVTLPTYPF
ncbi:MAG: type I polyketide synthase, partial [candidate division KSB1 bacterium]